MNTAHKKSIKYKVVNCYAFTFLVLLLDSLQIELLEENDKANFN